MHRSGDRSIFTTIGEWAVVIVSVLLITAVVVLLHAYLILYLWNYLVDSLHLSLPKLNVKQAVALFILLSIVGTQFRTTVTRVRDK